MAITVPQWIKANSGSTASFTSNTTTGNTLVACITYASTTVTVATCKTPGNTFTQAVVIPAGNATGGSSELWYFNACTGETAPTVTLTWSGTAPSPITIDLFELHSSTTGNFVYFDKSSSGANRATAVTVTSLTPTNANSIVIACARCSATMSTAALVNTDLVTPAIRSEYTIQTTATAVTSIGTDSASNAWNEAVAAAFYESPWKISPSGIASATAFGTANVRGTTIAVGQWIKSSVRTSNVPTKNFTSNTSTGNTLVACIINNIAAVTAVSTPANTFTQAVALVGNFSYASIWYVSNCVGETAPTVTVVAGGQTINLAIDLLELSSLNPIGLDLTSSGTQTGLNFSVTSMTPSGNNEIVIACVFCNTVATASFANSNWLNGSGGIFSEYTVQTTATAITLLGTTTTSTDTNVGVVAAFTGSVTTPNIAPSGIASTTAFGTTSVAAGSVDITPSGIAGTNAFGTANIATDIEPSGIASTNAFGTALVSPGAVSIAPAGIASTNAFGTASVAPGAVNIAPSGIASTNAFGTASIAIAQSIAPSGIASTTAFGTATVVPGVAGIAPLGIASTTAFGTAVVLATYSLSPTGIASSTAFGSATLLSTAAILPAGISSTTAFGSATLLATTPISATGIASVTAFGTASVSLAGTPQSITASGLASTNAFGTASVTPGAVSITTTGIASSTTFGTATIDRGAVNIAPSGIASVNAFGTATVAPGSVGITATGIASTLAFGTATLLSSAPILATGIASTNAFGTATVARGAVNITPSGIASGTAFGTAVVSLAGAPQSVTASGIASVTTFGSAVVSPGSVAVAPAGIASVTVFGSATLLSALVIAPTGIASTSVFGAATISVGAGAAVNIAPSGIASTNAFGTASVASVANLAPSGIASTNAFGTAVVIRGDPNISPSGIGSTNLFGTTVITLQMQPVPPYTGQEQPTEIVVPAIIYYREVWEEGPWAMPPYAWIYPRAPEPVIEERGYDQVHHEWLKTHPRPPGPRRMGDADHRPQSVLPKHKPKAPIKR